MIVGFRHKGLERFHRTGSGRGIQSDHAKVLARILVALEAASKPDELNLPSFKLHPLKGKMKGYWSIWVNGNWRVTFRFVATDVTEIDYVDYH